MHQNIQEGSTLEDRVSILHPQVWKLRREKLLIESQRIYEEKIQNNHLLTSHNLLGYIDKKLATQSGDIFIDMSSMAGNNMGGHPYELEQIENLNKLDQAKYLSKELEKYIEYDSFSSPEEKQTAETNLKSLNVY